MQEESKNEELETPPADSAEPSAESPAASNPPEPASAESADEAGNLAASAETPELPAPAPEAEADVLPGADQDDSLQAEEALPAAEGEMTVAPPADETPLVSDELAPQTPTVTDTTSEQPDGQVEQAPEDLAAESQAIDPKIDIGLLEAYLFSTHSPLTGGKLAELFNLESTKPIRKAVRLLNEQYEQTGRCFRVEQVAGGFQLLTLPNYGEPLKALHQKEQDAKLTKAALETLAIIAYKQPILRADVEAIRGVASGETIRSLMEKHLVKIAGRAEEPGRPILYGTTKRFLEVFGLNSLKDLPQPDALQAKAQQLAREQLTPPAPESEQTPALATALTAEAAASAAEPTAQTTESTEPAAESPTLATPDEQPASAPAPADVEAAATADAENVAAGAGAAEPPAEPAPAPAEEQPAEAAQAQASEPTPAEPVEEKPEPPADEEKDPDQ